MILIRILVLKSLTENVRVYAHYISSSANIFVDLLSRGKLNAFKRAALMRGKKLAELPTPVPEEIWPIEKIWLN